MSGKLTARKVETAGPGEYGDGDGLSLRVSPTRARAWVYRYSLGGRRREMGIDAETLAEAREKRDAARQLVKSGIDPIEARRNAARARVDQASFGAVADQHMATKGAAWKNEKHRAQWEMTLREYAGSLHPLPAAEITTADVLAVLTQTVTTRAKGRETTGQLWRVLPETASRLRGRIEAVLSAAKALKLRTGENPAAWKDNLEHLLPPPVKLSRGHHAAVPYSDIPALVARLRLTDGAAARALELAILTAARSGEVLGARWEEIDADARLWTVPAVRMKAGREHRVPLSARAKEIIEAQRGQSPEWVFPGAAKGKPLSNMAMQMVLRRLKIDATPHGTARSAFRDWAGDCTPFPREVAEAALAHIVGDKAEQAYRRGDALQKRRELMEAWARYCGSKAAGTAEFLAFCKGGAA